MKTALISLFFTFVPTAFAGVAQEHFIAATKSSERIVVRDLKANAVVVDTKKKMRIAEIRDAIVLVDRLPEGDTWTLPSFCCAEYSIAFHSSDGSVIEYVVKHGITAILAPDAHGLHDLTDIPLTAESQKALRSILKRVKSRSSHHSQLRGADAPLRG
jgi:hypothetical protein